MADPETETAEPRAKTGKGRGGARARIEVEGDVDPSKVGDVLEAAGGGRRSRSNAGDPDKAALQKFSKAIRDPNNRIVAQRIAPATTRDGTPLADTYDVQSHEAITEDEIKRDLQEARGGKKWIVKVYDSDENIIASRSITVGGEPKLDPMLDELTPEPEGAGMETGTDLTEEELLEQTLARDPDIIKARKNLRLKQLKNEEEEEEAKAAELRARRVAAEKAMKGETENGNGNGKHKHRDEDDEDDRLKRVLDSQLAPLREQNAELKRQVDAEKARNADREATEARRRELEAATAPLRQQNEQLKATIDAINAKLAEGHNKGPTADAIMAKLESLKTEIKSDTKDQIMTVVNSLTAKIDVVATTLNTFMSKGNDPATQALIQMATSGGKGGTAERDPFHGLERALTVMQNLRGLTTPESPAPPDFPSYLVEKMAEMTPEVLNFFKEQRGSVPTKEEINAQMKAAAMKMYEGLDVSMKQALEAGFQRLQQGRGIQQQPQVTPTQQVPAGGAPAPAPAQTVPVTVGQNGPAPAPGVVPFPGSGAPAAANPAPAPAAAPAGPLTPEQLFASLQPAERAEYTKRVNWVLGGMLSEMKLGVRDMHWPEKAHGNLPKPLIDQLVEAQKDSDIHNIVKPYADQALLASIWGYLSPSNKDSEWYQEWLTTGINWIKQAEGYELVEASEEPPVVED